jgi:hypothetical protein
VRPDQQAVIALINRSTVLLGELNRVRRSNRELEQRLDEAIARIDELESSQARASADDGRIAA